MTTSFTQKINNFSQLYAQIHPFVCDRKTGQKIVKATTEYECAVPENSSKTVPQTKNDKSTSPGTLNNNPDWSNVDLAKKIRRGIQYNHTAQLQWRIGHSTRSTK